MMNKLVLASAAATAVVLAALANAWADDVPQPRACSLVCPPNITANTGPGQCGAVVSFAMPMGNGCGPATCDVQSGSLFPKGETTVNCSAMDATDPVTGTPGSCSFKITVNDAEPPTILCPADNAISGTFDRSCMPIIPDITGLVTASDNCPGPIAITQDPAANAPSQAAPGTTKYFVTLTATDASGNISSCVYSLPLESRCGCGMCGVGIPVNLAAVGPLLVAARRSRSSPCRRHR